MRYIIECGEWRLLQALGKLVGQRKSRFVPTSVADSAIPDCLSGGPSDNLSQGLLEFELRRVFLLNAVSRALSDSEFEECDTRLKELCHLLNGLVDPRFATRSGLDYPCLRELVEFLQDSDETYDLASSSNPSLFKPPDDDYQLSRALKQVTEHNDFLTRALSLPTRDRESRSRPAKRAERQRKRSWKDLEMRDRATSTLGALFDHLKCGRNHEIILKLSEEPENGTVSSELDLMLSTCPDRCGWLEVHCGSIQSRWDASIGAIQNICADISENTGQGKGLVVLIEQYGLFGAWTTSQRGSPAPPDETLEKLISNGAFEQLTLDTLASGSPAVRYKPQEKRALAVRLGYCLMDFFDSDLSSKRIYFLGAPSKSSGSETLYLSFDSGYSATDESHIFRVGHPALLSFAKLLLEIEFGKIIDLEVTRHYGATNRATWAALCEMVDILEEERDDSYVQAIRGCLMVHSQISKALRLSGTDSKTAELTIRKEIYRELVCKLEDGLVESIPRYQRKRQRSESPEPITRRKSNARATRSSWDTALSDQSRTLEHPPQGSPAYTSPGTWTKCVPVEAVNPIPIPRTRRPWIPLPKSTGLFDDYTPDNVLPDVAAHADSFINHHRNFYDNLIQNTPDIPRIKVAVLDTGLDVGHPSIQANVEQIKDVKSWLPANSATTGSDPCGHGTHVIGLLLDVAPDCDVYVAQIADNKNPLSLHQIAKAVDHAVAVWQVDIISMSFGVLDEREDGCDELRAALLRAHAAKVLMFAAASNTGGVDPAPAFPARLSNVFCIYSGDGKGNYSRTSPSAGSRDVNFLTLGEGVESAWPRHLSSYPWTKRKSGTSFAAPIAAGMVAVLLLYACQNLPPDKAEGFKEYDRMKSWLLHVSNERAGYNVLSLSDFVGRPSEERRLLMTSILEGRPWKR